MTRISVYFSISSAAMIASRWNKVCRNVSHPRPYCIIYASNDLPYTLGLYQSSSSDSDSSTVRERPTSGPQHYSREDTDLTSAGLLPDVRGDTMTLQQQLEYIDEHREGVLFGVQHRFKHRLQTQISKAEASKTD